MEASYTVSVDRESRSKAALAIILLPALGASAIAIAVLNPANLPRRIGASSAILLGVWMILAGLWMGLRTLAGFRAGGRTLVLDDGILEVQTWWKRVRIPASEVTELVTSSSAGRHVLKVRRSRGIALVPVLAPEGKDWNAVATELGTAIRTQQSKSGPAQDSERSVPPQGFDVD
jgi:hypothetical protein